MRILTISDLYPPFYVGGYELRCKEMVDEITSRGHEVSVLTSWWGLDRAQRNENIYRFLHLDPTSDIMSEHRSFDFLRWGRRLDQLRWAFQCRKNYRLTLELINSVKPDLVYVWNMEHVGVTPILAAQNLGLPIVYSLGVGWLVSLKRELYLDSISLKRKFRQMVIGLSDFWSLDFSHMIAISRWLQQYYVENGFLERQITVIPRGIPSEWILEASLLGAGRYGSNRVKLLFVGRVCPEKAPDDAIRAVHVLVHEFGLRNVELDIIGNGTDAYLQELRTLIVELSLDEHVRFLRQLNHHEVIDAYPGYDILLFPSRWEEPLGVTVLEAMARGTLVVAADRGGISEMIVDGKNGLLVSSDNPGELAEAVRRLTEDQDLAYMLRLAALKTVRERFTLDAVVTQTLEYFEGVLAERFGGEQS